MQKRRIFLTFLLLAATVIFISIPGCSSEPTELPSVEITEYEGEKLNSVDDFAENSVVGVQEVDMERYRLRVNGIVDNTDEYTYDEVLNNFSHYEKLVKLYCVEGWSVNIVWGGIKVSDIIAAASPDESANTVIFTAWDGYTTSLPLDYIIENDILMAFEMNRITMPAARGYPFALVAESKWGYKWIKWIKEIELSDDSEYRGYWESRGYSNSADLEDYFFEDPRNR